jgi:hypothetical protein
MSPNWNGLMIENGKVLKQKLDFIKNIKIVKITVDK